MIPTIKEVIEFYRQIAQAERVKTGRPGMETVANVLRGTRTVCEAAEIPLDARIDQITRKAIDTALAAFMRKGIARISAWSYVCQLRGVFARWCIPYYKDAGWEVSPLEMPVFRANPPRYVRPSAELLNRVKVWYGKQRGECWFAATMMLEFAVRNGDVLRLRKENFVSENSRHYLHYTPHKTALTSGRRVYWPIHETIWQQLDELGGMDGLEVTEETFTELNRSLRSLGFHGNKAAYELRKICIDHIYQKYGAEMATSISGDDIKTISRYYADPAQPNAGAVRVIDML